ncbi:MAG: hypothetical protein ACLU4J_15090 [Butyricimonas paravirosa]
MANLLMGLRAVYEETRLSFYASVDYGLYDKYIASLSFVQMGPIISVVTNSLIDGLWGWLGTWEMNILWKNFLFLVA